MGNNHFGKLEWQPFFAKILRPFKEKKWWVLNFKSVHYGFIDGQDSSSRSAKVNFSWHVVSQPPAYKATTRLGGEVMNHPKEVSNPVVDGR